MPRSTPRSAPRKEPGADDTAELAERAGAHDQPAIDGGQEHVLDVGGLEGEWARRARRSASPNAMRHAITTPAIAAPCSVAARTPAAPTGVSPTTAAIVTNAAITEIPTTYAR